MKIFITLSKKTLCIILAALIITVILIGQLFTIRADGIDGSTNALRCEFISGLGYTVNETAISEKKITIPESFTPVYERYNELQKTAGFDLTQYRGKTATLYTYKADGETVVNIIVSQKSIIGGDVSSVRIDGEMKALVHA